MLNFKVSVDVDVNHVQYPIMFDRRNVCVHCGSEGSLTFVDKFGKETKKEIHPFDHIKCKNCGRHFSILWEKDNSNGKMYPIATDYGVKREFLNMISHTLIKDNKINSI